MAMTPTKQKTVRAPKGRRGVTTHKTQIGRASIVRHGNRITVTAVPIRQAGAVERSVVLSRDGEAIGENAKKALAFIREEFLATGVAPSTYEIAQAIKPGSKGNTVAQRAIVSLEKAGLLVRLGSSKARQAVPLLNAAEALALAIRLAGGGAEAKAAIKAAAAKIR